MVVHVDRNMMLTPDEYMSLMRLIQSERESEGATLAAREASPAPRSKPKRRRSRNARTNDKKMSVALERANADLRKVNGDLRKGVTQADIMRRAHRIKKTL